MFISFVVNLGSCDWGMCRGADVGLLVRAAVCAALARGDKGPPYDVEESGACCVCPERACPGKTDVGGRTDCMLCTCPP
jgi:hypothetical protein